MLENVIHKWRVKCPRCGTVQELTDAVARRSCLEVELYRYFWCEADTCVARFKVARPDAEVQAERQLVAEAMQGLMAVKDEPWKVVIDGDLTAQPTETLPDDD